MIPVFYQRVVDALADEDGNEDHDDAEPCLANCVAWKWGFTAMMLVVAVAGGLAPILIHRVAAASRARRRDQSGFEESAQSEASLAYEEHGTEAKLLRLAELFSGGILFGVAIFHLVPEGLENRASLEQGESHGFPVGLVLFSLGFLLTVGLEMVAVPLIVEYRSYRKAQKLAADEEASRLSANDEVDTQNIESQSASNSVAGDQDVLGEEDAFGSETSSTDLKTLADGDKSWHSLGTAAAVFAGLSMHAPFAGLSLGISSLDQAVFLFIAIISHKGFETFTIGLQLVRAKVSLRTHLLVVIAYAIMSPLGVVIGLAVHQSVGSGTTSTVQLLAAGMLFAVAVVGSLGFDTEANKRAALNGYLAYIAGVVSMGTIFAVLAYTGVLESGHGHGDH